jgi:hypothetical protein
MRIRHLFVLLLIAIIFPEIGNSNPTENKKKYSRKLWRHWTDADKDCQNTRIEVLVRDNVGDLIFRSKKSCKITTGKWISLFSGKTIINPSFMDIDHIVPLKHAFLTGGNLWDKKMKETFANDLDNLIAVESRLNRQKSSKSILRWLPPYKNNWCTYITKWIFIKQKYRLLVTSNEINLKKKHCSL